MSYIKLMIFLFILSFLMIGGELYRGDQELGIERDIYNHTSQISVPLSNISASHPIEQTRGLINEGRLYKIVESGINFLLISAEQVSKMGIEYGYQNPEINFKVIWKYLVYILIIIIGVLLLKPLGYLIVFLIMLGITIVEQIKKRKKIK